MPFDPQRYTDEVLKPLRGGTNLPADLLVRYAVEPRMDRDALAGQLKRVRGLWNQKASGAQTSLGRVCKLLLSADQELERTGAALSDPRWWQAEAERGAKRKAAAAERVVVDMKATFGGSKTVTRAQLDDIAKHSGLDADAVADAATRAGLRVVDAVAIPDSPGMEPSAYTVFRAKLAEAGAATVVHLLHPGLPGTFQVVRRFKSAQQPQARLDGQTQKARKRQAESTADSPVTRAAKSALGLLGTAIDKGEDPRLIALYHLADLVQLKRGERVPDRFIESHLTGLGLEAEDAVLLVASTPHNVGSSQQLRDAEFIQQLLSDGQLREAQRVLAGLAATSPGHAEIRTMVEAVDAECTRIMTDFRAAVVAGRFEDAGGMLRRARQLASDDEAIGQEWDRLPPAPAGELTAAAVENGVRLAWRPAASADTATRYLIRRHRGRPPMDPREGQQIAEVADPFAVDTAPFPGEPTGYAVFASRNGKDWSSAATVSITVVPPVSGVDVEVHPDRVTAAWAVNPAAIGVKVRRAAGGRSALESAGTAVPATLSSFEDTDVTEAVEYHYAITAVYAGPRGQELLADPIVVRAVPRGRAVAVATLSVSPVPGSEGTRITVSWTVGDPSAEVRIRRYDRRPAFRERDEITLETMARSGSEVVGTRRSTDAGGVLLAPVPPGQVVFVAFSIGTRTALVGPATLMNRAAPVSNVQVRRYDDVAVLSWVWPEDAGSARVRWSSDRRTGDERSDGERTITRTQYVDENGCRLPLGTGDLTVLVRTVTLSPLGEVVSEPTSVAVRGRPVRVAYRVGRQSGMRGWTSRTRRRLAVTADRECAAVDLVVVAAAGPVMPLRPDQGTEVTRRVGLSLSPGVPQLFDIEVPGTVRRPCWLRCFVLAPVGATVADPPVNEMKVS